MPVKKVNDVRFHYREIGDRMKQTIVFGHPMLFDASVFDSLVADLEKHFHLILLDVHGHGESDFRMPLSLDDITTDFHQLLRKLNLSKVTWVGYSIGGMVGMRLAVHHPEVIESLVLMATTARPDPPALREQTWWLWQMFRAGHREDIVDAALRFFFAPATFESQPDLIATYRSRVLNYDQRQAEGMFEVARAVLERRDFSQEIASISVPTLVIGGRDDLAPSPDELELIASQIPQARLVVIDEASHLLAVEKPAEVTRIVREFLHVPKPEDDIRGDGAKGRQAVPVGGSISSYAAGSTILRAKKRPEDSVLISQRRRRAKRAARRLAELRRTHYGERIAA
jgi:3-oxoadipate enol-lactonase